MTRIPLDMKRRVPRGTFYIETHFGCVLCENSDALQRSTPPLNTKRLTLAPSRLIRLKGIRARTAIKIPQTEYTGLKKMSRDFAQRSEHTLEILGKIIFLQRRWEKCQSRLQNN